MSTFTKLEEAALHSIFAETPDFAPALERQLEKAAVTQRVNTGGGFYTDIAVADDLPRMNTPKVLGYETHARVEGLTYGLGFVLFIEDGRLHLLEGFAVGPEDTTSLNLEELNFAISKTPFDA